jgi:hypothetical protein
MKRNVFRRCTVAPRKTTPRALSKMGVVMSKNWILLAGLLVLASMGTSRAHPLDSPDIVYIDGQPCNTACQNYLAWTRRRTTPVVQHSAPVEVESLQLVPEKTTPRPTRSTARRAVPPPRQAARPAAARQAASPSSAKIARPQPELAAAKSEPAARPEPAAAPKVVETPPVPEAAAAAPPPAPATEEAKAAAPPAEQVAAATPAAEPVAVATPAKEPLTTASTAPAPQPEAIVKPEPANKEASSTVAAANPNNAAPAVSAAANNNDARVAVVMTRPEIEKLSDLSGKDVAIEEQQSEASKSLQAAIVSAGAAEVRLNEGAGNAIERLLAGEVPAAVLAIASPKASEGYAELPGYRIFRIPLSPDPSKG